MIPYFHNYYNPHHYLQLDLSFYRQPWFYPLSFQLPNAMDVPLDFEIQGSVLNDKNDVSNLITPTNSAEIRLVEENNEVKNKDSNQRSKEADFNENGVVHELTKAKRKHDCQKDGRNSNSNLLRMFFRRMEQIIDHEPELIKKIIKKNKMRLKQAKFVQWYEYNQVQHRNYIRLPSARKLFFTGKCNKEATKILRIILKDFIQREALCAYLTSKKIKRESIPYHLLSFRNIFSDLVKSNVEE